MLEIFNNIYIFFILLVSIFIKYIISYPEYINLNYFFNNLLINNKVNKILIKNNKFIYIKLFKNFLKKNLIKKNYQYTFDIVNLEWFKNKLELLNNKYNLKYIIEFSDYYNFDIYNFFINNSFIILLIIFIYLIINKTTTTTNFKDNIVKTTAKLYDSNNNNKITLKDIAGLHNAKKEIKEVINFLKQSKKYSNLGCKIPKGILLVGPPGTGKTMLAKAVAGEANVPFFYLSGSDFVELYIGVGPARVRDLFNKVKKYPASIIFIDEIDTIGKCRDNNNNNDEKDNSLNQLLTEMDGFNSSNNVIVLAATNRYEILDPAILRSGRFDRKIFIELPNTIERKEIFKKYLSKIKISNNINLDSLVEQTSGYSGADISNICNEAALIAVRNNKKVIDNKDLNDSIDRILIGLENTKIISDEEKKRIAYHESGHALINYLLNNTLVKLSIIPRGKSLGYTQLLPRKNSLTILSEIKDDICVTLGGRASEYIIYKNFSTGALNDLITSTKQASRIVKKYGFCKSFSNISYYNLNNNNNYYLPYSQKTAYKIDKEIKRIVNYEFKRSKKIIKENINKLHLLSKELLKKKVLFKEDVEKLMINKNN